LKFAPLIVSGAVTDNVSPSLTFTVATAKVIAFASEVVELIVFEGSPNVIVFPDQVPVPARLCAPLRSH